MPALILLAAVAIGFGYTLGIGSAHSEISRECDRLGAFYIRDRIYECQQRDTSALHARQVTWWGIR